MVQGNTMVCVSKVTYGYLSSAPSPLMFCSFTMANVLMGLAVPDQGPSVMDHKVTDESTIALCQGIKLL